MDIKRIIQEQLLIEGKIAQIAANIKFFLDVNDTEHSKIQKTRHANKGIIITDEYIMSMLEKAKSKIASYIIGDRIRDKIPFVITELGQDKISLAIIPKFITPYKWNLTIKTVWSEKAENSPFKVGKDQMVIYV